MRLIAHNRKAIRRRDAERYLLLTLLSFAFSVSFTRLFLSLAGFPQIGNAELHIAHVLWGGVLLFAAALLPLIIANRWVLDLVAILAGVGVGLFIDEVGKFITQTNDYFYPAAAPIIYVFFLLTVLLFVMVRRPRAESVRRDLYHILEDLEEVIDRDLSQREFNRIRHKLLRVQKQTPNEDISSLASHLLEFLDSEKIYMINEYPSWLTRLGKGFEVLEKRYVNRPRFRAGIIGGLVAWGAWALTFPVGTLLNIRSPGELEVLLNRLVGDQLIRGYSGLTWFGVRVGLEGSVGFVILLAAILITMGRDRRGIMIAYIGLLFSLTVVNILMFYFEQFSTIISSTVQLLLLMAVLRYRARFLDRNVEVPLRNKVESSKEKVTPDMP